MSLPRPVFAGRFYLITRRCTQRQFLLRPDKAINNAFVYCLAVAAKRHGIDVLNTVVMSNHHHTIIFDRSGCYPAFIEYFHKLLARCLNVYWRRRENFWSSHQTSVVHLVRPGDVIDKLVYVAMNPVAADLVAKTHQWPGINGYTQLRQGKALHATRPPFFFRDRGHLRRNRHSARDMPATATLEFVIPPELKRSREEVIAAVASGVETAEAEASARRKKKKITVLGRRRVRSQPSTATPSKSEAFGTLNPTVAAGDPRVREDALARKRAFLLAYREARSAMLSGNTVPFPQGTYWLRRFASVPIA